MVAARVQERALCLPDFLEREMSIAADHGHET